MGWTYGSERSMKALHRNITQRQDGWATCIAKASKKFGRELYVVWEKPDGVRFIAIYLCNGDKRDGDWSFGYKDMTEACGPTKYNCPVSFFDLVQDPGGYATAWRAKCRANADAVKRVFHTGDHVLIPSAQDTGPYTIVEKRARRASYIVSDGCSRYTVATQRLHPYVAPTEPPAATL